MKHGGSLYFLCLWRLYFELTEFGLFIRLVDFFSNSPSVVPQADKVFHSEEFEAGCGKGYGGTSGIGDLPRAEVFLNINAVK